MYFQKALLTYVISQLVTESKLSINVAACYYLTFILKGRSAFPANQLIQIPYCL